MSGTLASLTADEKAAIRRCGGTAYVGLVDFFRGRRGGRFRNVRTPVFRTEDPAAQALTDLSRRYRTAHTPRLLLVDATGAYEEITS